MELLIKVMIYVMVYAGSALMVYNIIGFIRFAAFIKSQGCKNRIHTAVIFPIILLVMFLLGYLAVGIIGKPDLIVSGILFGGSIFVFIMYRMLHRVTLSIIENDKLKSELKSSEEVSKAKTVFLSTVSHELRTPMNMIIGYDTLALSDPSLSESAKDQLVKIGQSADHMLTLINGILDLNSFESGELSAKPEPFSVPDISDRLSMMTEEMCEKKGLDDKFSASDIEDLTVNGDMRMIRSAIVRIIENAVKYTDAPGTVSLSVSAGKEKNCLIFTVSDTGSGISQEFLPHIYEAFAQEDGGSTSKYSGSGLSMTLVRKYVDLLNGGIDIKSGKGIGTTVTVTVPVTVAVPIESDRKQDKTEQHADGSRIKQNSR